MMAPSALSLVLGVVAAAAVDALGCYSRGPTFSDLRGGSIDGAVEYFCRNQASAAAIGGSVTVSDCYPFGGQSLDIQIRNFDTGEHAAAEQECLDSLRTELRACGHGSGQDHGVFWYRIAPWPWKCGIW